MQYTKYELARIVGARALQLSMGAPFMIKRHATEFDTVRLAQEELNRNVLPITVKRPRPIKLELSEE